MRRLTRLLFFSLVTFIIMAHTAYADNLLISQRDIKEGLDFCREFPVSLQVDGETIICDVPPVIIKDRTLIPARAVFESMGAEVEWNEDARLVEVSLGTSNVQLTIDSRIAFVNGKQTPMDVPAMILNDRTLILVRFVGESLSCAVDWDDLSRTVKLFSPVINEYTEISDITFIDEAEKYRIVIKGEGVIEGSKSFAYNNPERFGIDIKNAQLKIKGDRIDTDNELIRSIRFSQFEPGVVRVVIDLEEKIAGKISFSTEKDSLYIDFNKSKVDEYQELGEVTKDGLAVVDWRATEKLVVIDPGHGGKDPGSRAIRDGVVILNEKEVNLDVAHRLNRMLQEAGVSTYMLRKDDTYITLYGRPELANAANAYLYISIHNNYSDNPSANGVETFYYSKENECDYGIYSEDLAKMIQKEMVKSLGLFDRGAKSEPAYAVLNKTVMPAIIIEGAFLSNDENLELMMTDEFRELYALSAAKSIVKILNDSVRD
jgi:N-acetylmuramoyl-L-alanine amidase